MNFNLDKNNIVGFIAGFFTTTALALTICKFSYDVIEKGNKQEIEIMRSKIADKDNKINNFEQQLLSQTKTVETLHEENAKLKEKIQDHNSIKTISKTLKKGESWVDNKLGIFIKVLGVMTISKESVETQQVHLEMKFPDSLSNSFYLGEKESKSYIKTFRANSENYKLTIKTFDPLTFVLAKND